MPGAATILPAGRVAEGEEDPAAEVSRREGQAQQLLLQGRPAAVAAALLRGGEPEAVPPGPPVPVRLPLVVAPHGLEEGRVLEEAHEEVPGRHLLGPGALPAEHPRDEAGVQRHGRRAEHGLHVEPVEGVAARRAAPAAAARGLAPVAPPAAGAVGAGGWVAVVVGGVAAALCGGGRWWPHVYLSGISMLHSGQRSGSTLPALVPYLCDGNFREIPLVGGFSQWQPIISVYAHLGIRVHIIIRPLCSRGRPGIFLIVVVIISSRALR